MAVIIARIRSWWAWKKLEKKTREELALWNTVPNDDHCYIEGQAKWVNILEESE